MPFRYHINSELNIILIIGEGLVTGSEYFKVAEIASQDKLRKWGMVTIVDLLSAELDFELKDIRRVIEFTNNLTLKGFEPEEVAALASSKGIHLIGETLKLLSGNVPVKISVFTTLDELISSLGLSEHKQELVSFYNRCKFEEG
jgi:hypothetical protein